MYSPELSHRYLKKCNKVSVAFLLIFVNNTAIKPNVRDKIWPEKNIRLKNWRNFGIKTKVFVLQKSFLDEIIFTYMVDYKQFYVLTTL